MLYFSECIILSSFGKRLLIKSSELMKTFMVSRNPPPPFSAIQLIIRFDEFHRNSSKNVKSFRKLSWKPYYYFGSPAWNSRIYWNFNTLYRIDNTWKWILGTSIEGTSTGVCIFVVEFVYVGSRLFRVFVAVSSYEMVALIFLETDNNRE